MVIPPVPGELCPLSWKRVDFPLSSWYSSVSTMRILQVSSRNIIPSKKFCTKPSHSEMHTQNVFTSSPYPILAVFSQQSICSVSGFVQCSRHFFALCGIIANAPARTRMLQNKVELNSFYRAEFLLQKSLVSQTTSCYPEFDNTVLPGVWIPLAPTLKLLSSSKRCHQDQLVNGIDVYAFSINTHPRYLESF